MLILDSGTFDLLLGSFYCDFRCFYIDLWLPCSLTLILVLEFDIAIFDCIFQMIDLFLFMQYSQFTYDMLFPLCQSFKGVRFEGCFLSILIILIFDPFDDTVDFCGESNEFIAGIMILLLLGDGEKPDFCGTNY